jgi:signal peptidase I
MIEKIEREIIKDGEIKKLVEIKEKLPKEFGWLLQIKAKIEKGYLPEFYYYENGNLVKYDKIKKQADSEAQSYVPVMPDLIKFLRYEPGKGFVVDDKWEGVRNTRDPPVDIAIELCKIADNLIS